MFNGRISVFAAMSVTYVLSVSGDVLLRIGSKRVTPWPWILGCAILYASTTPFWFIVFRGVKSFTSVLFYWPVGSLIYLLTGVLILQERPALREWGGILLALAAKVVGG